MIAYLAHLKVCEIHVYCYVLNHYTMYVANGS